VDRFIKAHTLFISILTAILPGEPGSAGFMKLRMTEVVVTIGAITRAKIQSNCHHQQTNTQLFYGLDALPVAQPTVSKHWREMLYIYTHWS